MGLSRFHEDQGAKARNAKKKHFHDTPYELSHVPSGLSYMIDSKLISMIN